MPDDAIWDHPFTQRLIASDFRLEPFKFSPSGTELVGIRFLTQMAEIVYRFDTPEILRVVLYRRLGRTHGAASGFQDFIWLVWEANDCGITHIIGVVSPRPEEDPEGMEAKRIAAFYTRHLGAEKIGTEWGSDLIRGDLAEFRRVWKRRPPPARPATTDVTTS